MRPWLVSSSRASRIIVKAKRVMLFDHSVYAEIKAEPPAMEDGVILIIIAVGLLLGISAAIGIYLKFAAMPSMSEIAEMVRA